jgi:ornithine decarboxylase
MKKSEFSANGNAVENLIRRTLKDHSSPVMLIRKSLLKKQFDRFRTHLPEVAPYYAIKANPHPEIIKTFAKFGACFDVASANEMNLVLNLGVAPRKIIFANTIKSTEDLQSAHKRRVTLMTFDNESELYKIAKYAPGARVIVRIKVENVGSIVELSLKFGADPEHAVFLLRKAKGLGLHPEGVSFHVGSQCANAENYIHALELAAGIFKEAKTEGLNLSALDIGGGFPIRHSEEDKHIDFEAMARKIRSELKRLFDKKTKFIAEPGRLFAGPAGVLVTQVIGRTFRNNKNYYYLNDGLYGDFSGIVFDHCKYELKTLRRGQKFLSTVAGPTCDSFDTISLSEELPELEVGSVVYVKNIGAYSSASAVQGFNGFAPAKIMMVD